MHIVVILADVKLSLRLTRNDSQMHPLPPTADKGTEKEKE
jgi:hypothetical protein